MWKVKNFGEERRWEIERARKELFFLNSNFFPMSNRPTSFYLVAKQAKKRSRRALLFAGCGVGKKTWVNSRLPKHERKSRIRYAASRGRKKKKMKPSDFLSFSHQLLHALPHIKHTHKTKPTKMFTTMSMKTVAPVRVRSFLRLSRARRRANLSPQIFYFVPFMCK